MSAVAASGAAGNGFRASFRSRDLFHEHSVRRRRRSRQQHKTLQTERVPRKRRKRDCAADDDDDQHDEHDRDTGAGIPASRPGLLRELSAEALCNEPVRLSRFNFVVTRECEQLAAAGALDGHTQPRDLERLCRRIMDFILQQRDSLDRPHRLSLWISLCKLYHLRFNVLPMREPPVTIAAAGGLVQHSFAESPPGLSARRSSGGGAAAACESTSSAASAGARVRDPLRQLAETIDNEQLARWMYDNEVFDDTVLHRDAANDSYAHTLNSCGLAALWNTILALKDRWPYLSLSAYVIALVEQLMRRVAFFFSHQERLDTAAARRETRRRRKILGLAIERWRVRSEPTGYAGAADRGRAGSAAGGGGHGGGGSGDGSAEGKLNSVEFTRVQTDERGETYATINEDFIEETERVLVNMLRELRAYAGFEWHLQPAAHEDDCIACEQLADARRTDEAEREFDAFIEAELRGEDGQTRGAFSDMTEADFREQVWSVYAQPSEAEAFHTFNPYDKVSAQNFISRNRNNDSKVLQARYVKPQLDAVWDELIASNSDDEPAFALLAALVASAYMQSKLAGAELQPYTIECKAARPFLYDAERRGATRAAGEFHVPLVTCGTFRMRNKTLPTKGLGAARRERLYEHPLIFRTINSFCVHYGDRMHHCAGGFAHAFAVWLAVMCEDAKICGELSNGASLLPLYRRLFPSRSKHIDKLAARIERSKRDWDPTQRLLPADNMRELPAAGSDGRTVQF